MEEGNLTLAPKSKANTITDIQVWTDAFFNYASVYASTHSETTIQLFKYIHKIWMEASTVKTLEWRDYDIKFRLKKETYMYSSISLPQLIKSYGSWTRTARQSLVQIQFQQTSILKCFDFNYKGQCSKYQYQYKHEYILCALNHSYIRHRPSSGCSLKLRSGGWRQNGDLSSPGGSHPQV